MARSSTTFVSGKSGNPAGRPAVYRKIRELAQQDGKEVYEQLKSMAFNENINPRVRAICLIHILDIAYGKPEKSSSLTDKQEINIFINTGISDGTKDKYKMVEGSVIDNNT